MRITSLISVGCACALALMMMTSTAGAKATPEEIARLGADLTRVIDTHQAGYVLAFFVIQHGLRDIASGTFPVGRGCFASGNSQRFIHGSDETVESCVASFHRH